MTRWLLLFAILASVAWTLEDNSFANLWKSTWRNITIPRSLPVTGSIPAWVRGSLVRNAGGAFETKTRNATFAFDGVPKLFKFSIADGRVSYQERFFETGYYQYISENGDIPKVPLMGPTEPPLPTFAAPAATAGDVDNIQVWKLKGDKSAFAMTDSATVDVFDIDTLRGLGQLPVNDSVKEGAIQLSCAHPQYEPKTDQKVMLNFASTFLGLGALMGHHEIVVFRMGADHVRRPFGSVIVPYAPYVHSFAVTETKMVFVAYPLGFDVTCVLEFKPMITCMQCPRDRHATIYVFDLASTTKATKPSATIDAPYHMVMHHVNAYDVEGTDDIEFEVAAQDSCDTLFAGPTGKHANLAAMRDPSARDRVQHWGTLRNFKLSLGKGDKPTMSYSDRVLRDSEGYIYDIDFPFVNPDVASNRHRYVWGLTSYARNSTHYEDWAVLKIDRAAEGANTKVWYKKGHYPSEPVFVPRPGGFAEDDGVVVVQVLDGQQDRGYLLVLNGTSMEELATASLEAGEHLPYSQHGRWFDEAPAGTIIV